MCLKFEKKLFLLPSIYVQYLSFFLFGNMSHFNLLSSHFFSLESVDSSLQHNVVLISTHVSLHGLCTFCCFVIRSILHLSILYTQITLTRYSLHAEYLYVSLVNNSWTSRSISLSDFPSGTFSFELPPKHVLPLYWRHFDNVD